MQAPALDAVFSALSDPTRRRFVRELAHGPRSISELASGVSISLPAVSRHIKVLERSGLLVREKRGRTHWCSLAPGPLDSLEAWLTQTRSFWEGNLDSLAVFLEDQDG